MIIPFNNRLYDYFFKNYTYLLSKAPFPPSLVFDQRETLKWGGRQAHFLEQWLVIDQFLYIKIRT